MRRNRNRNSKKAGSLDLNAKATTQALTQLQGLTGAEEVSVHSKGGVLKLSCAGDEVIASKVLDAPGEHTLMFNTNIGMLKGILKNRETVNVSLDRKDTSRMPFRSGGYTGFLQVMKYVRIKEPEASGSLIKLGGKKGGKLFELYNSVCIDTVISDEALAFMLKVTEGKAYAGIIAGTHWAYIERKTSFPDVEMVLPIVSMDVLEGILEEDSKMYIGESALTLVSKSSYVRIPSLQLQPHIDINRMTESIAKIPQHKKVHSVKISPNVLGAMLENAEVLLDEDTPLEISLKGGKLPRLELSIQGKFGAIKEFVDVGHKEVYGDWKNQSFKIKPDLLFEMLRFMMDESVWLCFIKGESLFFRQKEGSIYQCTIHQA